MAIGEEHNRPTARSHRARCWLPLVRLQRRNCRNVKVIFSHVLTCGTRCDLCEKVWSIYHARACRESNYIVPRCRDLREYLQQQQQQQTRGCWQFLTDPGGCMQGKRDNEEEEL